METLFEIFQYPEQELYGVLDLYDANTPIPAVDFRSLNSLKVIIKERQDLLALVFKNSELDVEERDALFLLDKLCDRPSLGRAGCVKFRRHKRRVDVWRDDCFEGNGSYAVWASFWKHLEADKNMAWFHNMPAPSPGPLGFVALCGGLYHVVGGELWVMLGNECNVETLVSKKNWHFPFAGDVARGIDSSWHDAVIREWNEARAGDQTYEWNRFFLYQRE